ncbi:MAG: hypothetical protein GY816_05675 [Cytophagales bacterium]|nr:hypothetical protein [Cytophagales bacterium]
MAWLFLSIAWSFQYFGMVPVPLLFYIPITIVYGLIGSLPYLLDLLLSKDRTSFAQTLIFPASWALIDYLTQYTPYGSWGHAAYSQHTQLVMLQTISLFGMSFITFLIGWFASISNWAFHHKMEWQKIRKGVVVYASLLLLTLSFGSIRLVFFGPDSETVRIASISADKKQDQQTDPEVLERFFANQLTEQDIKNFDLESQNLNNDLFNRSIKEADAGAKIIFWGEANGTTLKQSEEIWFDKASQIAKDHEIYLGTGLGTLDPSSKRPLENKLALFEPSGKKTIDYWKAIPVPGGEAAISATNGTSIQTTDTPYGKIGAVVCFDMDFPQHLSQASDIDILLVPSNDWKAIDPWHTHMSRFRAIEQGFNMVRQTSNGLSVGADYTGRVISEMDHYSDNEKILITSLPTKGVTTLYSIIGDTFPLFCFVLIILVKTYPGILDRKVENFL